MNILILGGGAREHAIAKAFNRSKKNLNLFCLASNNNPGIKKFCKDYLVTNICDPQLALTFAKKNKIDFAFIGPEAPLEIGMADFFWKNGIPTIGPQKNLARIETSKAFTRDLLKKYNIPGSPRYQVFHNLIGAKEFLEKLGENHYVIKADSLMGGKGVKVAGDHLHSITDAYHFCQELHEKNISFVIEEKFIGQEFSAMCFCDGENIIPMPLVQDHKRAFVGDKGPNTGGMGSYSDSNHLLPFLIQDDFDAAQTINQSVFKALMQECGEKYIGILYGSFIATKDGIGLIEYNARFGDPEAMNVLSILESDFVEVCQQMLAGTLKEVKFKNLATVCKYAVPQGYPDNPVKNIAIDISGIKNPEQCFLAAVDEKDNQLIATGSRTGAVIGIGETITEAESIAEEEIKNILGNVFHREDIGTKALIETRIQQMQQLRGELKAISYEN